ncbi:exported hypothetical protein [Bradyrhizobium sp. ORS 375]|nr:exported hypothetical protein [Bradyrhizobium sp. ORS 375]
MTRRSTALTVAVFASVYLSVVMAGLVPAIHVERHTGNDVDARDKPGHDGVTNWSPRLA